MPNHSEISPKPTPWRAVLAGLVAVALVAAGATSTAVAATDDVTGFAFRDFNSNGAYDTGNAVGSGNSNDVPLSGVLVHAYDASGTDVGNSVTGASGAYSISSSSPAGTALRVEFTLTAAQIAEGYRPSPHGPDNGTSVQFVTVGATDVDFAANVPEDYIQAKPMVAITAQEPGNPLDEKYPTAGNPSQYGTVFSTGWESSGKDATVPDVLATASGEAGFGTATGAIYGVAAQRGTTMVYSSAVLRRHTGLGIAGMGAIYATDSATGQTELLVDLDNGIAGGIDVGEAEFSSAIGSAGSASDNSARGLTADPNSPSYDSAAWSRIGRSGLGGLAMSSDQSTLYAINLFSKSIVAISIADPTQITEVPIAGLTSDQRPFGVSVHRGNIYVGVVTTGEDATGDAASRRASLQSEVLVESEADVATSGNWSSALSVTDMTFLRGAASDGTPPTPNWTTEDAATHWNAWTDDFGSSVKTEFFGYYWMTNAQPILSSMTFDVDGNMVLGFLDRFSFQGGMGNYSNDDSTPDVRLYATIASGGLYAAAPSSTGSFTSFTFESGGMRGGAVGAITSGVGPGGGQFFRAQSVGHSNALTGAVAAVPGFSTFFSTGYDLTGAWVSDAAWVNVDGYSANSGSDQWNANGLAQRILRNSLGDNGADPNNETIAGYGKAGGLGGVTVLAELAPVEIGNYVWFDVDQDGLQDADELPISGMVVELYDAAGTTLVSTTTTDAQGEYYFDVSSHSTYTVKFVKPTTGSWDSGSPVFGSIPWTDMGFTTPSVGSIPTIDSHPDSTGMATVIVGGPGENDHTIDAGLVGNAAFTIEKLIGSGTPSSGQKFTIDLAGRDFRGDPFAVTPASVTIAAGETSSAVRVPAGAKVKLTEASDASISGVTYGGATRDSDGYVLVQGGSTALALTVTNDLFEPGRFSVQKLISGDFALTDPEVSTASFTINYSYPGGSGSLVLDSTNSFAATSPDIPYGTVVTISEAAPTGAAANVGWETPVWNAPFAEPDGSAMVTIGDDTTAALTVTNPTTALNGTFTVTKSVMGDTDDRVGPDVEFTVEYSLDGGTTWTALGAVMDGGTVSGPASIPTGTVVQIREVAPPVIDSVEWGTPAFSGEGVAPGSPATFTIGNDTTVAVLLENPVGALNGQFSVSKDVTGPGENLLMPDTEFTVNYTYPGGSGSFTLANGQTQSSGLLPTGTVVTITEMAPTSGLPSGATWGNPSLTIDGVPALNGGTLTIGDGTVVAIVVANPTDVTPTVDITKGDGSGVTIAHEADTVTTGEAYENGETREIVIVVENTGPEPLRNVMLTDETTSGGSIAALMWTFPDSSTAAAEWDDATMTWSATWPATFSPMSTQWAVGEKIYGSATLTMDAADDPHQNVATVDATGAYSGKDVMDDDPYNAFTGAVQVIKYDGELADPVVKDGDAWVTPMKPLLDVAQDANTADSAVNYPIGTRQGVRWVVTNTGTTWLTDISLVDVTDDGPSVGADWTADLSEFGGPTDYSFADDGNWQGLFPPGASFFAEGTLMLSTEQVHADTVTVIGTVVVPQDDPDTGLPTDQPLLDSDDQPIVATQGGAPFTVTDLDPFHAKTPAPPVVRETQLAATGGIDQTLSFLMLAAGLLLAGAAVQFAVRRKRILRR